MCLNGLAYRKDGEAVVEIWRVDSIKVGKSWRIHPQDLDRLLNEQLYKARAERAARMYPDFTWVRGYCDECGSLMPEPQGNAHWVCSPECRENHDRKAAAVVGYGTEEFAECSATVVPPY